MSNNQKGNHLIYISDSRDMSVVSSNSVELVVTSPPYWQLKDYGHENQIGFGDSFEDYINNLNLVWQECIRILKPGCRLCINIGDQFARAIIYGRYKVISIQSEIIRFCETLGMDYMGTIIWRKVTNTNTTGGAVIMGSFPYPRNGIVKIDYEYILLFRKPGKPPIPSEKQKKESALTTDEWNEYFSGHWNFSGEKQNSHLAPFPVELPYTLIRMFTFPGETALDPFIGSGTTAIAAMQLGRNSIGFEINQECKKTIKRRMSGTKDLFSEPQEIVFENGSVVENIEKLYAKLPYLFADPHKMDKRTDPRQYRFGSRVASEDKKGSRLYKVTDVTDEGLLVLDTGLKVKPMGNGFDVQQLHLLIGKQVGLAFSPSATGGKDFVAAKVVVENASIKKFLENEMTKLKVVHAKQNVR